MFEHKRQLRNPDGGSGGSGSDGSAANPANPANPRNGGCSDSTGSEGNVRNGVTDVNRLPIDAVLPLLRQALRSGTSAVLTAQPGAGKTTRVPPALLDEPWLEKRRIVMLEPRRLAARSAAKFMAASLGEEVGETVGYRVRMDTRVGSATRIEVVTEGVLTRMLQTDPALENVSLVIFDEFHERSLHADVGLALCLQARAILRDDLRILVMSATMDSGPVAALLDGAPVLQGEGRVYPVATRYAERPHAGRAELAVVRTVLAALENDPGDILVFLPGTGEIRRVEAQLKESAAGRQVRILQLHGSLSAEEQDRALSPAREGERKVVLATSVAETSLTVEGIRVVIDSGLMRVPRFSPRTGMTRLETVTVSQASADQRRGRAGRLGPGVCYRLWTEREHRQLVPHGTPEIAEADLAPLALELAAWGAADPAELRWLDPPPSGAYGQARELLRQLGALDAGGAITPHGKQMAALGMHPRLAHMALRAVPFGLGALACELAALLGERDLLRGSAAAPPDADMRLRVEALRGAGAPGRRTGAAPSAAPRPAPGRVDPAAARRVLAEARQTARALGIRDGAAGDAERSGLLLAFAYPDRIAKLRSAGRFLLRNGRGAAFGEAQPLSQSPYLVAAELDDRGAESRIMLAAPVSQEDIMDYFSDQISTETETVWNASVHAVQARRKVRLGALLLKDEALPNPDPVEVLSALISGLAQDGFQLLPWTRAARQLQQRLLFIRHNDAAWPDVSDEALAATVGAWLGPHLYGMRTKEDLQRLSLSGILEDQLSWEQRRELDGYAPTHITVPSGFRVPVDYSDPAAPALFVRLQEMFGLTDTPRIGRGRVLLTLNLLSPAQRPVQVTRDLASFWRDAYFEVKKDLKGRYPKHYWPDHPHTAPPTNRTRPRPQ